VVVVVVVAVTVLAGAVVVTVLACAVEVTVLVLGGSVMVETCVEVAVVEGLAAYTAAAPMTNPTAAPAPIFKNVLLSGSVGF